LEGDVEAGDRGGLDAKVFEEGAAEAEGFDGEGIGADADAGEGEDAGGGGGGAELVVGGGVLKEDGGVGDGGAGGVEDNSGDRAGGALGEECGRQESEQEKTVRQGIHSLTIAVEG